MGAVRKAVPAAVPAAVVQQRQTSQGQAPYKESKENADYPGANPVVLAHGEDVSAEGNRLWGTTADTESTYSQDFAPSIPGPSDLPSRVEPKLFGGSVSQSEALLRQVKGEQAPNQDTLDTFTQTSQRLDNHGKQATNNTGQMTSYPSEDGETYRQVNLGTQSQMQGFTMTEPGSLGFDMTRQVVTPQAASSLPPNSGTLNDSVYGVLWQGTGSTVVNIDTVPATTNAAPAPPYAPLGWG